MATIEALCPRDGRVLQLLKPTRTRVGRGDPLLSLSADDEASHAQLKSFEQTVAMHAQMVSDAQLAARRQALTTVSTFAQKAADYAARVYERVNEMHIL